MNKLILVLTLLISSTTFSSAAFAADTYYLYEFGEKIHDEYKISNGQEILLSDFEKQTIDKGNSTNQYLSILSLGCEVRWNDGLITCDAIGFKKNIPHARYRPEPSIAGPSDENGDNINNEGPNDQAPKKF